MRVVMACDGNGGEGELKALLSGESGITIVGDIDVSRDGDAACLQEADLVFLCMRGSSLDRSFSLVHHAAPERPLCIVVADDDRLALRAIELRALDYLVRPVPEERLREALLWARSRLGLRRGHSALTVPLEAGDPFTRGQKERLMVKWRGRIFLLKGSDIQWIEAEGGYVRLHCGDKKYMLRGKIGDFEQSLPCDSFIRIHRSALVNIDSIAEILQLPHGEYAVLLRDGTRLSLGRSYRDRVFRQFVDISKAAV